MDYQKKLLHTDESFLMKLFDSRKNLYNASNFAIVVIINGDNFTIS